MILKVINSKWFIFYFVLLMGPDTLIYIAISLESLRKIRLIFFQKIDKTIYENLSLKYQITFDGLALKDIFANPDLYQASGRHTVLNEN